MSKEPLSSVTDLQKNSRHVLSEHAMISPVSSLMTSIIGWTLQLGVLLSCTLILIGMILLPSHAGGLSFSRVMNFPHTPSSIWAGLLVLRPQAIIVIGLLLLMATPIVRVIISVVAFALERDWRYVLITLIVLSILILGLLLGKGGA